ncbi:MAG TPA: hypothetical protein VHL58_06275 [Thermoanaerobaculia bacterium]|nr:hypothetical protein [Thermoanaerobaculia bacterium]
MSEPMIAFSFMRIVRVSAQQRVKDWLLWVVLGSVVIGVVGCFVSLMRNDIRRASEPVQEVPGPVITFGANVPQSQPKYQIGPIGTFILKPGEWSEWYDLPDGSIALGADFYPNRGHEKIMSERYYKERDGLFTEPVTVGNENFHTIRRIRYHNTLDVEVNGQVKAWYPEGVVVPKQPSRRERLEAREAEEASKRVPGVKESKPEASQPVLEEVDADVGVITGTVTVCKGGIAPSRRDGSGYSMDRQPLCVKSEGKVFRLALDQMLMNDPPIVYQGAYYHLNQLDVGDQIEVKMKRTPGEMKGAVIEKIEVLKNGQ